MQSPPASAEELAALEAQIDGWLERESMENSAIDAFERDTGDLARWYVRLLGEEKDIWTAWLTLGQRT